MAFTSPKMSLRIWNLLTDLYDHSQLADNWAKVDYHDHSPGKGVQVPTEGLADGAVTGPKLATALDPSGAYTAYRTLRAGSGSTIWSTTVAAISPFGFINVGTAQSARMVFRLDPADHAVAGRTAKLRTTAIHITNGVAPGNTVTVGLYPVATFGAPVNVDPTIATAGTVVSGSTVSFVTQALGTQVYGVSTDFDVPTAGYYFLGVVASVSGAAQSQSAISAGLEVHYI